MYKNDIEIFTPNWFFNIQTKICHVLMIIQLLLAITQDSNTQQNVFEVHTNKPSNVLGCLYPPRDITYYCAQGVQVRQLFPTSNLPRNYK